MLKEKNKINIMVIDDDRVARTVIRNKILSINDSISIEDSPDFTTAINTLKSNKFDCIILDYHLIDKNGIEILEELNSLKIHTPVVMLTGQGDEQIAVKAMQAGAYDYLSKKVINHDNFSEILNRSISHAITVHRAKMDGIKTRQSLELREERYRSLVENSPILILRFFPDDNIISFVNDGFCNYFGINRYDALGEDFYDLIPEELKKKAVDLINTLNIDHSISTFENYSMIGGRQRWQFWTIQAIFGEEDNILEFQCMGEDFTELKNVHFELENQKFYLQSILDSQENMIVVADKDEILLANKSFLSFFGYSRLPELKSDYKSICQLSVELEGYESCTDMGVWLDSALNDDHKFIVFKPEIIDSPRIFSAIINKLSVNIDRYVISFTDVTILEMKSKKFEKKASFDALTKIYNRGKFYEILKNELNQSEKYKRDISLIFFDIDHFKKVNDTFGHKAGDYVLIQISALIKDNIRELDIFCRWGGGRVPYTDA